MRRSYLYYPGCSLAGSARAYASSLGAILEPLGIELARDRRLELLRRDRVPDAQPACAATP